MIDGRRNLDAYLKAYEVMGPDNLDVFDTVCDPDVRFVDPFNDLRGVERLKDVYREMYDTLDNPRFTIHDSAVGEKAGYIRWQFDFALRGREMSIDGMSEVAFGPDGRVVAHVDHWDSGSQVYARIPVLGAAIGLVRRRIAL
ncbi:nuclear transport factor 2 family protein [Thalassobaculum sp. OXR-137]|uniref:nuclear transport factor 2 family protein n=1 Tax=Thalassobaculum sp. OXR-137 TaxID=3100173 RepID=UPI002AC8B202|nr:nuclear transport factor 2 family protein [Thalassobaculum sp. OXR-137]WPZ36876.1 nuclear transport factor 2 family protein [Thalassobaculum sp. OXR-137]